MFLAITEVVLIGILVILFITQVMIPLATNRKTFPLLRKRATIEKEIQSLNTEADDIRLAQIARELREKNTPPTSDVKQ